MKLLTEINIHRGLYLRNPYETNLGRSILKHGIILIEALGFEHFTFKKLATHINSTEASIYRYFENKHLLLVYLSNWYWEYMYLNIQLKLENISDPEEKLNIAIEGILFSSKRNTAIEFIDEDILHRIMISQADKVYRIKEVSEENKNGFFLAYKRLVKFIADIILENEPNFPYSRILASTLMEMPNQQLYYAQNLPSLTNIEHRERNHVELKQVMRNLTFSWLKTYDSF
jgi:AcrR family transcriptional regulator